ncbi:MAG TPA: GYD domain-containing protein [Candidatus Latescibacteria bacterium]|nr:GYD domain-containing protein [Candidatus Latescibacterota bacterium]
MLFVTVISIPSEKAKEAVELARKLKPPIGINVREAVVLFGKPDALVLFEAPDEKTAMGFVLELSQVGETRTSMAVPIAEL